MFSFMTHVLVPVPRRQSLWVVRMCGQIGVYPSLSEVFKCWNIFISIVRYALGVELKSEHTIQFYLIDRLYI